ncbi:hypothetical protein P7K49_030862 [Saguinus oedipus]|uniref:Uncharacterized protein n=1 Tax=Saguinus oedipus TaxID=9490 RepID=A0ABQ9U3C7_SAGOE|nr:hypothetical protein P7K49_030862 [Saguinus oedipus]
MPATLYSKAELGIKRVGVSWWRISHCRVKAAMTLGTWPSEMCAARRTSSGSLAAFDGIHFSLTLTVTEVCGIFGGLREQEEPAGKALQGCESPSIPFLLSFLAPQQQSLQKAENHYGFPVAKLGPVSTYIHVTENHIENAENKRTPHFQTNFGRSRSRRFPVEELHESPVRLLWPEQQFCQHLGTAALGAE